MKLTVISPHCCETSTIW